MPLGSLPPFPHDFLDLYFVLFLTLILTIGLPVSVIQQSVNFLFHGSIGWSSSPRDDRASHVDMFRLILALHWNYKQAPNSDE